MKEFLKFILIEPFEEGGLDGIFIGVIGWICALFLSSLILWGVYYMVDNVGVKQKEGTCTISSKHIRAAYTTTTMVMSGKVMVPIVQHHPEQPILTIDFDGKEQEVGVSHSFYGSVSTSQKVNCKYINGRISKSVYIKSLSVQ